MLSGARPLFILQTGEHPLWFQLTEDGPVHIESIEDAVLTSALVPWPYALHICYLQKTDETLVMPVNRDGFLKIEKNNSALICENREGNLRQSTTGSVENPRTINSSIEPSDLVLYRFSSDFWQNYTVGGFVYYDEKPAALLYLETRFMDTKIEQPNPFIWSFNMASNNPFPIIIPILEFFPIDEGWKTDSLRFGNDGFIYYRVVNRNEEETIIKMLRTNDLSLIGEEISPEVFYGSVPRKVDIHHPLLPILPEGFVYTGIEFVGNNLFASWEEQEDYNIGAAGFMVIKTLNISL